MSTNDNNRIEIALKAYEEKENTIKYIIENLKKWKDLSPEERIRFTENTPYKISALDKTIQKTIIKELAISGIFNKKELQNKADVLNELYERKKPEEEEKKKKIRTKTLIPGLIHLVDDEGYIKYLVQKDGNLIIEETYVDKEGHLWRPKQGLPIYHVGTDILFIDREIDFSLLLKDVIAFIKNYLELPEESGYLILALWVFHTYLIEKCNVTPIMYFFGLMETGKSRAGEVLQELAYKCERMTSPTEATLFRGAEHFKTALVIDEVKLWGKGGNQEVARLIKSRYKRGLMVPRINLNLKGENQIEYFDVFAPLVIATTEAIPNIIESRCIRFTMQKNANPKVEKTIDTELAKDLRNKLTIFRAKYIDIGLKEAEDISRRRLNEILKPLYQILMEIEPNREDEFKSTVKGLEESRKSEEGFTDTAEIVKELDKLFNEENRTFIHATELTERLNKSKSSEDEKTNVTGVGWKMRPLGFKKAIRGGKVGYIINKDTLSKLIERFNVPQSDNETDDEPDLFSS